MFNLLKRFWYGEEEVRPYTMDTMDDVEYARIDTSKTTLSPPLIEILDLFSKEVSCLKSYNKVVLSSCADDSYSESKLKDNYKNRFNVITTPSWNSKGGWCIRIEDYKHSVVIRMVKNKHYIKSTFTLDEGFTLGTSWFNQYECPEEWIEEEEYKEFYETLYPIYEEWDKHRDKIGKVRRNALNWVRSAERTRELKQERDRLIKLYGEEEV